MKEQKIIEGWGSIGRISAFLKDGNYKRVLLFTGKRSFESSPGKDVLIGALSGLEYRIFNDFRTNPKYEDVLKGLEIFNEFKPDLIIAIGGGTVMDMAKLVNAFASTGEDPAPYIRGEKKLSGVAVPMTAIPTTSGTGSEATHFAVVYLEGSKYSVAHPGILPDCVVLDAELTGGMPPFVTAYTGMDALCQGIESYWSVNSTEASREYSRKGIELAVKYLRKVVSEPDAESREALLQASYNAGKGINLAKTTAAHAFSYWLTSNLDIPHGQAVGLMMGWVFQNNLSVTEESCTDPRGAEFVKARLSEICEMLGIDSPENAGQYFNDLMDVLGLNSDKFVLNEQSKSVLFEAVNRQRLKNNPVEMSI